MNWFLPRNPPYLLIQFYLMGISLALPPKESWNLLVVDVFRFYGLNLLLQQLWSASKLDVLLHQNLDLLASSILLCGGWDRHAFYAVEPVNLSNAPLHQLVQRNCLLESESCFSLILQFHLHLMDAPWEWWLPSILTAPCNVTV